MWSTRIFGNEPSNADMELCPIIRYSSRGNWDITSMLSRALNRTSISRKFTRLLSEEGKPPDSLLFVAQSLSKHVSCPILGRLEIELKLMSRSTSVRTSHRKSGNSLKEFEDRF